MATLLELVGPGKVLEKFTVLRPREQEVRCLFVGPAFRRWARETLPTMAADRSAVGESPTAQLTALLRVYCSGLVLSYGRQFNTLDSLHRADMWKLKTPDIRVFGWFPQKDHFIAVNAAATSHVKAHDLYHGFGGDVERFRNSLDLDPPKSIPGTEPEDVVSNCYRPRRG